MAHAVGKVSSNTAQKDSSSVRDLIAQLMNRDLAGWKRLIAVQQLGMMGRLAEKAAGMLREAKLHDPDPAVRDAAADALQEVTPKQRLSLLEVHKKDLEMGDRQVQHEAGRQLLAQLKKGVVPFLTKARAAAVPKHLTIISNKSLPWDVRYEAVKALSTMGPEAKLALPAIVELILERALIGKSNMVSSKWVRSFLINMGPSAVHALAGFFSHLCVSRYYGDWYQDSYPLYIRNDSKRYFLRRDIGNSIYQSVAATIQQIAVEDIEGFIKVIKQHKRSFLLYAFDGTTPLSVVEKLLREPSIHGNHLSGILKKIGTKSIPVLLKVLSSKQVSKNTLLCANLIFDDVELVNDLAKEPDLFLKAITILNNLLRHPNKTVRSSATKSLGQLFVFYKRNPRHPLIATILPNLIRNISTSRRADKLTIWSIKTLGELGSKAAPAVHTLVKILKHSKAGDLALYVVGTLESIGPAAEAAITTLARIVLNWNAEPYLRIVAAKAIGTIGISKWKKKAAVADALRRVLNVPSTGDRLKRVIRQTLRKLYFHLPRLTPHRR